jgi:hypothetical protein
MQLVQCMGSHQVYDEIYIMSSSGEKSTHVTPRGLCLAVFVMATRF